MAKFIVMRLYGQAAQKIWGSYKVIGDKVPYFSYSNPLWVSLRSAAAPSKAHKGDLPYVLQPIAHRLAVKMAAFELRAARYVTAVLADHQNGKVTLFVEASGGKSPVDLKEGAALGDAIHPEDLRPGEVAGLSGSPLQQSPSGSAGKNLRYPIDLSEIRPSSARRSHYSLELSGMIFSALVNLRK